MRHGAAEDSSDGEFSAFIPTVSFLWSVVGACEIG